MKKNVLRRNYFEFTKMKKKKKKDGFAQVSFAYIFFNIELEYGP